MLQQPLLSRDSARRRHALWADVVVTLGTLALLYVIASVGGGALASFKPPDVLPTVSLDPSWLPYYAARSTLRMFIALFFSLVFTLTYGYFAAHSEKAERVLIPLLDILQSIPVLGFLSITVSMFIALFPGSLLGLECASLFAIFTGQAWNMAFSFYHSLKTLPIELDEAVTMYRLPRWQRFVRLEIPASMIGLLWNAMMSFGAGWFFVAASEAISVLNQNYTLPGIGSYVTQAIVARDARALFFALITMGVIIVIVDQFFWRPLVAWADKFKLEKTMSVEVPQSWLLDLLRSARLPQLIEEWTSPVTERFSKWVAQRFPMRPADLAPQADPQWTDWAYNGVIVLVVAAGLFAAANFVLSGVALSEVGDVLLRGLATLVRVMLLLVFSTVIWTPIGVAIGFSPRLARLAQPVVQFLASFPANFLFPFVTVIFIRLNVNLNWGGVLLMALGAQWYILFNAIAGAIRVPRELRDMATNMGLRGWRLWRFLIIPGIFPAWVTGGITAAGGAWNASIVSEIVGWGSTTLQAYGLGAYVAHATNQGDWPRIVLGVGIMSLYVVGVNRLLWGRLFKMAEEKYRL